MYGKVAQEEIALLDVCDALLELLNHPIGHHVAVECDAAMAPEPYDDRPQMISMRYVLPDPDGPMMASTSPGAVQPDTPSWIICIAKDADFPASRSALLSTFPAAMLPPSSPAPPVSFSSTSFLMRVHHRISSEEKRRLVLRSSARQQRGCG